MPDPLSPARVSALLYELCVDLGFCLPANAQRELEEDPPREVKTFTDAVFVAEGMNPELKLHLWRQVRDRVAKHFGNAEGAALR